MDKKSITDYINKCHRIAISKGFGIFIHRINYLYGNGQITEQDRNKMLDYYYSTEIMMIASECAEAFEALRKGDTENFAEELADIAIKLFSFAGEMGVDLESEIDKKMEKNRQRPYMHGKRF